MHVASNKEGRSASSEKYVIHQATRFWFKKVLIRLHF